MLIGATRLVAKSAGSKVLGCTCAFFFVLPLAHADVYAFRNDVGQVRWTNTSRIPSSTEELVTVLPSASVSGTVPTLPPNTSPKSRPHARWSSTLSLVLSAARKYGLDPAALLALIEVESSFNSAAVSPKGARGLMQLMPATARRYGLRSATELHNPVINVDLGARHLSDLLAAHHGNLAMALASYNAGQPAVKRHGGAIPAYRETMLYVPTILARMNTYRSLEPLESFYAL